MSFTERLVNLLVTEVFKPLRKKFVIDLLDSHIKKDFPEARPIAEVERDVALAIVNSHPTTGNYKSNSHFTNKKIN